jgi:hypothetical protein
MKVDLWDDYGSPVERVKNSDPRWLWTGDWKAAKLTRVASHKGATASLEFDGTGGILVGDYLKAGGKAEVYLDGKLDRVVDAYPDEPNDKHGESVWHAFRLKPGHHTVKLVVLGETYGASQGTDISIEDFVVFR